MGNKRRRIALSCVDCRRRKVKCDRTEPHCLRCQKGGLAESCVYVPYEGADPMDKPHGNDDEDQARRETTAGSWYEEFAEYPTVANRLSTQYTPHAPVSALKNATEKSETIKRLEQKVIDLEARIQAAHSREEARTHMYAQQGLAVGLPTPASSVVDPEKNALKAPELEQILLRGKSFRTQYYGPSNYGSILLQFHELSNFIMDIMKHMPALSRYKAATDGPHKKHRRNEALVCESVSHEHGALLSLIPNRQAADPLVQHYLNNIECTYRVLHVPSFLMQYESFWVDPHGASLEFLVILLLAMATVYCVYPREPASFIGRSSGRREVAFKWIAACDSWMQVQSHKHVTIVTNQVQILLFLAKRMNCIKVKRAWTTAGNLLRLAMASGLHREPSFLSSKISVFDQEMRRRLWATVLELELLTAIDRGMPGAITSLDWDCQPPSNIDDESFDEDTDTLPPAKPNHEFTRTSFLCVALQTTPLRLEMLSNINRVKNVMTVELVSQYDVKIRQALASIPSWSSQQNISSILPRTLARLTLLEFINIIHQPFATLPDEPERYYFSRAANRDAAATILELYRDISSQSDQLILPFCRSDSFRAALMLCYDLSSAEASAGLITMFDRHRATELLEHALHMQSARVMQLGQGFHSFWLTSAALSLAYSKQAPDPDPDKFSRQASERVLRVNERVVALQEPSQDGQARLAIGDALLVEAQAVLAKRDAHPGSGIAENEALAAPEPFADTQLDFDLFNLEQIWDLASFDDFSWV